MGANVQDVSRGIGSDNRIGPKFPNAGPGYGGSCFPKDTLALLKAAEDYESPIRIVEAVLKTNNHRKRAMGRKVIDAIGGTDAARGKKVAMLGLTFKPNADDMCDSPTIAIAQALQDAAAEVTAYDPEGMELAGPLIPGIAMKSDPYEAIEGASGIALVTEWHEFRALTLTVWQLWFTALSSSICETFTTPLYFARRGSNILASDEAREMEPE